ncbi:MAG: hypothetical protein AB1679_24655 [Actinomycetota bacterium]
MGTSLVSRSGIAVALVAAVLPWTAPGPARAEERAEGRVSGISHAVRATFEIPFAIPAPVFGTEASVAPGPFAKSNAFAADGRTVGLGYTVVAGIGGALPPFPGIPLNAEAVQGPGEEDKTIDASAAPASGPLSTGKATARTSKVPEAEGVVTAAGVAVEGVLQVGSLVSRSLSGSDPATGAVRGEYVQRLSDVVVADGLFKAGSVDVRVTLSANGKPGGATATASFNLTGASVMGVPVVLDENGLQVQEQAVPADAKALLPTVRQVLGRNGAVMPPLMTVSVAEDGSSAGVVVTGLGIDLTPPAQPDPIGSKAMRLSFGSVMAEAVAVVLPADVSIDVGGQSPEVTDPPAVGTGGVGAGGTPSTAPPIPAPGLTASESGVLGSAGQSGVAADAFQAVGGGADGGVLPSTNGTPVPLQGSGIVTRTARGGQLSAAALRGALEAPTTWRWPYGGLYAILLAGVGCMGFVTVRLVRFAGLLR